jgi:hypothetical protein
MMLVLEYSVEKESRGGERKRELKSENGNVWSEKKVGG